jgi:hypothetical protein
VAVKGSVLLRVINYALNIEGATPEVETALYLIGKAHTHRAIRPWMYSVFLQTLMNTLSSRLGNEATKKVMEAWVNLFAYVFKHILPPAIEGRVVETELNINTSSVFADGRIAAEVAAIEEVKDFNRKQRSRGSSAAPSVRSSVRSSARSGFDPLGGPLSVRGRSGDDGDAAENVKAHGNGSDNAAIENMLLDSLHAPAEQLPSE